MKDYHYKLVVIPYVKPTEMWKCGVGLVNEYQRQKIIPLWISSAPTRKANMDVEMWGGHELSLFNEYKK